MAAPWGRKRLFLEQIYGSARLSHKILLKLREALTNWWPADGGWAVSQWRQARMGVLSLAPIPKPLSFLIINLFPKAAL